MLPDHYKVIDDLNRTLRLLYQSECVGLLVVVSLARKVQICFIGDYLDIFKGFLSCNGYDGANSTTVKCFIKLVIIFRVSASTSFLVSSLSIPQFPSWYKLDLDHHVSFFSMSKAQLKLH